jgi:formylglycine-generating enzyme required for sulfatase activity
VTQAEFSTVMGYNPSHFRAVPSAPVENVSWHEAVAYCDELSARAELPRCYRCTGAQAALSCAPATPEVQACAGYRLPTEAEWERAYRAGSESAYYSGPADPAACFGRDSAAERIGWSNSNSSGATHPVGEKEPNAAGLHDLAGNVWEWTADAYAGDLGSAPAVDPIAASAAPQRVLRGGSWFNDARHLRAANRFYFDSSFRAELIGLRCARTIQ